MVIDAWIRVHLATGRNGAWDADSEGAGVEEEDQFGRGEAVLSRMLYRI